jgi:hypothetical protein
MRGEVVAIDQMPAGQKWVAHVTLEGAPRMVQGPRDEQAHEEPWAVPYWPELVDQWAPEAVRAWLIQQAATLHEREQAEAATADKLAEQHKAILGAGEAAAVCREGEIGCEKPHDPGDVLKDEKPAKVKR